ncbi:MAG: YggS family pyridoxal phosphate-dependent enzyme [Acidobacteriota bacterium]
MAKGLRANLRSVRERIDAAAKRAGRRPDSIKLVAVSKTHPASAIRQAIKEGLAVFGENKVQEAESKIPEVGRTSAEWHLIGSLQKNKARKAIQLFDLIHSVDSVELASRLERICDEESRAVLPILVQVDIAGESTKSGIAERDLPVLFEFLKRCKYLRFDGLMVLPPYFDNAEDTRPFFRRLADIGRRLADEGAFRGGAGELSMGMSHDLEVAVEEGATLIRIGTAIFGEREKKR